MAGDQLVFDLATRPALGRADFFVAPANALALAQVDTWPDWPGRRLAVVGPAGAGKTHLAHVWAARVDALILPAAGIAGLDLAALPPRRGWSPKMRTGSRASSPRSGARRRRRCSMWRTT